MGKGWEKSKREVDRYSEEIKGILGKQLIREATLIEDRDQNTDLVFGIGPTRIACRVRANKFLVDKGKNTRYDVTIRSDRPSGNKTELEKIVDGWGDYFFYGFSSSCKTFIEAWRLIDLNALRPWLKENKDRLPDIDNRDGSSAFRIVVVTRIPEEATFADFVHTESAIKRSEFCVAKSQAYLI